MNRSPRPRASSHFFSTSRRQNRRFYEGGDTIPRSPDKSELLRKFRQRFETTTAIETHASVPQRFSPYELGRQVTEAEGELPVYGFKDQVLRSVAQNQITIITAETGAGKSTQIPQYLLEMGYQVNMTQPRRISATFIAEEMQRQINDVLGDDGDHLIAYHTAEHSTVVEGKTRVTVLTDGLRLVQEFGQRDELEHEVLIIDEVHEWNANIEVLIAQVKRLVKQKPELRVVIMSATMEAEKLAFYFADGDPDALPPIIEVPGRNYEVERIEQPDSDVVTQAIKYAEAGENILIFLPGVREIEDTMGALRKQLESRGIRDATILPLHSKLSQQEQEAVKGFYGGPKIICATNIAQTSITIPDVNIVIDSGLERRTEIDDEGVQSLNLRAVSRADMDQRAGRTGRVAPGIYIHTKMNDDSDFIPFDSEYRTDYPIAEILRTDVDRNTLLAASAGIDFYSLELFHPVEPAVIDRSQHALHMLGALDDDSKITPRGLRMIRLPMRPKYARMIIEAEDQGYKMPVRQYAAAMVAAMEVGGMPSWLQNSSRDWRGISEQSDSDHLVQLDTFLATQQLQEFEIKRLGLDVRNVERAKELYRKVCKRTHIIVDTDLAPPNLEEREQLRRIIASGMVDYVYRRSGMSEYVREVGKTPVLRSKTDRSSVIGAPHLVVGTPYGIERKRRGNIEVEHVIQDITAITPQILGEVAIQLCHWEDVETQWRSGRLKRIQRQLFRGTIATGLLREEEAIPDDETLTVVKQYVMKNSGTALKQLKETKKELEDLQRLTSSPIPQITQDDLESIIFKAMNGSILDPSYIDQRIREIIIEHRLDLDAQLSPRKREKIRAAAPQSIEFEGRVHVLTYHHGTASIKINNIRETLSWTALPTLPDKRLVQLIWDRHSYELDELQRLAEDS